LRIYTGEAGLRGCAGPGGERGHRGGREAGDQARLIDAVLAASPGGRRDWGICTECGMGRVNRDEIPALLDLHREIIAAR
jgi:hypothetical protein